jgi:hypothetical protein
MLVSQVDTPVKDILFRAYVLCNGAVFALTCRQFPFWPKRCFESFQTISGMERVMRQAGFAEIRVACGAHFICTARKKS